MQFNNLPGKRSNCSPPILMSFQYVIRQTKISDTYFFIRAHTHFFTRSKTLFQKKLVFFFQSEYCRNCKKQKKIFIQKYFSIFYSSGEICFKREISTKSSLKSEGDSWVPFRLIKVHKWGTMSIVCKARKNPALILCTIYPSRIG